MTRPNLVYLHSHDTGRYIQPYGYDVPTPNLQRLAGQGILFRQAFCGNPTCSASRAVLLTGQCAHSSGMLGLAHRGFRLADPRQHLAHTLRAAGYRTVLAGIQHVAPHGEQAGCGYDEVLKTRETEPDANAEAFLARAKPGAPFFLDVGFVETHRRFPEPGPDDDPRHVRPPAPLPDTPETRRDMACYRTIARRLDAKMGRVLAALDRAGLAENTLVICTTDHGIAFPGMKCNLTDHGIGVMLLMRGPGGFDGGRVCDELVSHADVFPTLCDLLAIPPPPWLQGRSVLPWVRGESAAIREEIFAEVNVHAAIEPMRAVRTRRWKYIRRYDPRLRPVLPNCDASPSKEAWIAAGWTDRDLPEEELYDLAFDPNETANRAGDASCAAPLAEMRGRLDRWMRETGEPLRSGKLSLPAGIVINLAGQREPDDPTTTTGRPTVWPDDFAGGIPG